MKRISAMHVSLEENIFLPFKFTVFLRWNGDHGLKYYIYNVLCTKHNLCIIFITYFGNK